MAYIDRDGAYPDEARYWKMVEDTITSVFLQTPQEASRLVQLGADYGGCLSRRTPSEFS